MATPVCQICLDNIVDSDALVTKVCGKNCSAQVCRQCMGHHVNATLQQFYSGVLPRVRCPICLVAIHFSRWKCRVPIAIQLSLMAKYRELCRQACVVTPPCCHKTDYTHLPPYYPERKHEGPLKLLPSQLSQFQHLCKQFCRHKVEPRTVLTYALDAFGDDNTMVLINELILSRIEDPERRATLLLSLMYLRPNTKTNCCGADFCFNCKRRGHHDTCEEEFDENNDLVRCRTCRVLLLKVDGCDAVNCVCGFNMNWSLEKRLRRQRKKGMIPVDIFDIPLTKDWLAFHEHQGVVLKKLRKRWVYKWMTAVRPLLDPVFVVYVWRFRLRKIIASELIAAWTAGRVKHIDQRLAAVKGVLQRVMAAHIWRRRFSKALVVMEPELFWKAYHRWHPEELQDELEEINNIFNIG